MWDLDGKSIKDNLNKEYHNYLGYQETLDIINKLCIEHTDIDCIFGFSQGAFLTILLSMLYTVDSTINKLFTKLKCVILCSGYIRPYPTNIELKDLMNLFIYDKKQIITLPSLHVFGSQDDHVTPDKSKEIVYVYKNPKIYEHDGKHFVPSKKNDKEIIYEFIKSNCL